MDKIIFKYLNILLMLVVLISTYIMEIYTIMFIVLLSMFFEAIRLWNDFRNEKDSKEMIKNLKLFKETNKSQKLLIHRKSGVSDLILEINNLLDSYDQLQVDMKLHEDSRKKLLSNLSHDIRTPLTSIIGYIDALKDGIVTSEEERNEFIDILSMKSKNLKELTDQIFNVARIDSDEIAMNYEYIELNDFIRNTVIDFIPLFEKSGIEFINEIKEEKFIVRADRIALSRIFQNIIKNSIQHGREGKILGVRTKVLNDVYRVVVWDKGKGIPKTKQKYIFERLFKVDDSRKKDNSNSGLGMSIAKKLVEKHNGKIFLRSEENSLTEFYVELPILKELNI